MAEDNTSSTPDQNSVRRVISIQAPPEVAWHGLTERMGTWWPLAIYKIGQANAVDAIIEPPVGGRLYERGEDGSTCDWGASSPGSRARVSCSRGTSPPTGSTTRLCGRKSRFASSPRGRLARALSSSTAVSIAMVIVATKYARSFTRPGIGAGCSPHSPRPPLPRLVQHRMPPCRTTLRSSHCSCGVLFLPGDARRGGAR